MSWLLLVLVGAMLLVTLVLLLQVVIAKFVGRNTRKTHNDR